MKIAEKDFLSVYLIFYYHIYHKFRMKGNSKAPKVQTINLSPFKLLSFFLQPLKSCIFFFIDQGQENVGFIIGLSGCILLIMSLIICLCIACKGWYFKGRSLNCLNMELLFRLTLLYMEQNLSLH